MLFRSHLPEANSDATGAASRWYGMSFEQRTFADDGTGRRLTAGILRNHYCQSFFPHLGHTGAVHLHRLFWFLHPRLFRFSHHLSFIIGKTLSRQRQQITEGNLLSAFQNHDLSISVNFADRPGGNQVISALFFSVWPKPGHRHRWICLLYTSPPGAGAQKKA